MSNASQNPPDDGAASEAALSTELLDAAVELMGRSGRMGRIDVSGASMLPTLEPGETLAVEFARGEPRFGELIVFRQHGLLMVHRCLGRARRGGWRSRGDGVATFDPAVTPERLVGRVAAVRRAGVWIDFTGSGARLWGRAVGLHDLCWGAAASIVEPFDRRAVRLGLDRPLWRLVGAVDRGLLALAHRLTFAVCHRARRPAPD